MHNNGTNRLWTPDRKLTTSLAPKLTWDLSIDNEAVSLVPCHDGQAIMGPFRLSRDEAIGLGVSLVKAASISEFMAGLNAKKAAAAQAPQPPDPNRPEHTPPKILLD